MPSPFPGMNPYLEHPSIWKDFHESYIPSLRDALVSEVMSRGYFVRVEETLYIREAWGEYDQPFGIPDVALGIRNPVATDGGVATLEAQSSLLTAPSIGTLPAIVPEEGFSFLEVVDRESRQIITVIELLSPSNKWPGKDRAKYLAKRNQILESDVHLVEIDLLRGKPRMPVKDCPPCDYLVLVSRASDRPRVGLWPIKLRDPLPILDIPLRENDAPAKLNLQAVLNDLYDRAGYEMDLYRHTPEPPLSPEDAAWALQFLPAKPA